MLGCLAAAARVSSFTLEPECRFSLFKMKELFLELCFSGLSWTDVLVCTTRH